MSTTTKNLLVAALLATAALSAQAQPFGTSSTRYASELRGLTPSQIAGEMPDYPFVVGRSGASATARVDAGPEDPRMRGDMGDHPHLPVTPGSKRPMERVPDDPRMSGTMPDHPHLDSNVPPRR